MLDFFVVFTKFFTGAEFFANYYDDTRKRINQAVDGIGHHGE